MYILLLIRNLISLLYPQSTYEIFRSCCYDTHIGGRHSTSQLRLATYIPSIEPDTCWVEHERWQFIYKTFHFSNIERIARVILLDMHLPSRFCDKINYKLIKLLA